MILITGGAGYIGSHTVLNFIENNLKDIVIFDSLETGHIETVQALQKLDDKLIFEKGDLKNFDDINRVLKKYKIDVVLHFAAYSLVAESVQNPYKYYHNNIFGILNLLNSMKENRCNKIVFSSTAAIFGEPKYTPIDENHPKEPINPYGNSKLACERILKDYDRAFNIKSVKLRYFNACGADRFARLGEKHDIETHLIPNILKSTFDNNQTFKIFGDDYDTKDGTCIRDYIDVEDLAEAHRLAYQYLINNNPSTEFNLGSSTGISVKEIFEISQKVTKQQIAFEIAQRREGDPKILLADSKKAKEILNWQAQKPIEKSIEHAYNFELKRNEINDKNRVYSYR